MATHDAVRARVETSMDNNYFWIEITKLVTVSVIMVTATVTAGIIMLKRLGRSSAPSAPRLDAIDDRLTSLQNAVDAIALEVERVSEGQRFTTRLLAERIEGKGILGGKPERSITPH
jgi:hypothetical protein